MLFTYRMMLNLLTLESAIVFTCVLVYIRMSPTCILQLWFENILGFK